MLYSCVSMVAELHHCTSVYRITPVDVNSRPSSCLTNFLLGGKLEKKTLDLCINFQCTFIITEMFLTNILPVECFIALKRRYIGFSEITFPLV